MKTKICNLCGIEKNEEEDFYVVRQTKRMGRCKDCHKEHTRAWKKLHKDAFLGESLPFGVSNRRNNGRAPKAERTF